MSNQHNPHAMPTVNSHERIVVLDFGGQYTQLIARRVREQNVFCEIVSHDISLAEILSKQPKGLIFSGGPSSVYDVDAPTTDASIYEIGVPILGICYGQQLMAHQLGGEVAPATSREYGNAEITLLAESLLFSKVGGSGTSVNCWMSHGDKILSTPTGFESLAVTENTPVAAMADDNRRLYGVQFHPEVSHTPFGAELLHTFLYDICRCGGDWTAANFIEDAIQNIREIVGQGSVVCGVSGGIDSCCVAALIHRAIGDRLTCIFVDHGLLRKGEAEQVRREFAEALGIRLISVDASERFLNSLSGVDDPEQKRKIIGREFIRVFEDEASRLENVTFLAQGTLYPDVIESGGSKHAVTIKTHHNVGGLPDDMTLKIIEPLRWLFKDEARSVAASLGLPERIVWRHPFPGPGLAIRILGAVTPERVAALQEADAIFIEALHEAGLYRSISQALAVLAPIRSVGVMGDQRTYAHPIILRAVQTDDFMTAAAVRLPYELLEQVCKKIVNTVPSVNRVTYDITSKPPATIEWE